MLPFIDLGPMALPHAPALAAKAPRQSTVKAGPYTAELAPVSGGFRTGEENDLVLRLTRADVPVKATVLKADFSMPSMMGMTLAKPDIRPGTKDGETVVRVFFPHGGAYRLSLRIQPEGESPIDLNFDLDVKTGGMNGMEAMHDMDAMKGVLGPWSMAREGSGTSWLPDDSPMLMKDLGKSGRYRLTYMGNFSLNYTDSNVAKGRGPQEFYSNSMPMLMARREVGGGTLGLRVMGSLDPVFNGEFGAPNLFQTGETAHGRTLVDRQHPHDLLAEISATYSHPLAGGLRGFVYLAPIGEPALANSMYLMRPSGMENPEAPISHHWFDSSHITFGVATLGLTLGDRWKLDGSVFNGQEPDENRYVPDNLRFDSTSARLTYNPSRKVALSGSYAYLKSPESTSPDDQHRVTLAANYGTGLRGGDDFAATAYWGRDIGAEDSTDAYLAEATLYHRDWTVYGRYENVAKDELLGAPEGVFRIQKFTFGATRDFAHSHGFDLGVGAYAGLYAFPSGLKPLYGDFPVTLGAYLRIRPGRMKMMGM